MCSCNLVDIDAELAEVNLGLANLLHQLLVRFGDIVEGDDAETKTEEKEGAKGDESPKGELCFCATLVYVGSRDGAGGFRERGPYDRDNLLLDESGERDKLEVESEVELYFNGN